MISDRYEQITPYHQTRMSKLYTALDRQTWQLIIIKTMLENNNDNDRRAQKQRDRFEREIRLALSLKHDHILSAIDHGEMLLEGTVKRYVAYPYIEKNLEDFLDHTPSWWSSWSLMQTADMILQAALALLYMHTRNQPIVHQDVKTDNFLVRREQGQARIARLLLCDFGISRPQEAIDYQTSQVVGTPNYMPPEQFEGYITCQSDQYSLAMMACYLLTGEYPLQANNRNQWWYVHKTKQPSPPSALNSQRIIPIEVDRVILKALSKEPGDRYPSVWEFARQLHAAIKHHADPHDKLPPDMEIHVASTAIPAKPKRDPIPLHLPIDTDPYQIVAEPPVLQQPIARRKDKWSQLPFITSPLLLEYRLPAPPQTICWSRDGEYLACLFSDRPPMLVSRSGKAKVVSGVTAGPVACWAPYGYALAISSQYEERGEEYSKLSIIDVQLVTSRPGIIRFRAPIIEGLDWSVKGELAVWPGDATQIQLYLLPQALLPTQQMPAPPVLSTQQMTCGGVGVLRWSPDGSLLAAGGNNGQLLCWRGDTHAIHWQDATSRWQVYGLAWSPDSTLLAVAFADRRVAVWNVHTHRLHRAWTDLPLVPRALSVSQAGVLAVASNQHYLFIGSSDEAAPFGKHRGYALAEWSPTRNELATLDPDQDTKLIIWQVQQRS